MRLGTPAKQNVNNPATPAPIILADFSRIPLEATMNIADVLSQVFFYLLSVHSCQAWQTNPDVTLVQVISRRPCPVTIVPGLLFERIRETLPYRGLRVLLAPVYYDHERTEDEDRMYYKCFEYYTLWSPSQRKENGESQSSISIECIAGTSSTEETLRFLQDQGLKQGMIPQELGGSLDYASALQAWHNKIQVRRDDGDKETIGTYSTTLMPIHFPSHPQISLRLSPAPRPPPPPPLVSAETASSDASSACTYTMSLSCPSSPKTIATSQQPRRNETSHQGTELSLSGGSWIDGRSIKGLHGPMIQRMVDESDNDFHKRRNALYGRRLTAKSRYRRAELERQQRELDDRNGMLRHDNRRLEDLISQARLIVAQQQLIPNDFR